MFCVYLYADPRTNHPFYVGMGVGKRWSYHLSRKDHSAVTNKIKQLHTLGLEPRITVWNVSDRELASFAEIELISKYGRRDLNTGGLLNLTDGGEGTHGFTVSEETRLKIGLAARDYMKCNQNAKGSKSRTGQKNTDEHNAKLSKARTGMKIAPLSDEHRRKLSEALKGKPKSQAWHEAKRVARLRRSLHK